jgi:hypothetical protein
LTITESSMLSRTAFSDDISIRSSIFFCDIKQVTEVNCTTVSSIDDVAR